jgi:hypothetical protein
MPRVPISEENKVSTGFDRFEQLKLETNEFARFWMYEEPWMEYVHELRAIEIADGMGVRESKTRRNGEAYTDWKYIFVGRPVCLGRPGELSKKGVDPEYCPACKDGHRPVPRYAANIVKYELAGGQPRTPFGATVVVWSFTARMYGKLLELQNGLGGDLRRHDLTLRCEDGKWQRNELGFVQGAFVLGSAEAQQFVKALLSSPANFASEAQLKAACGSERTRDQMLEDCATISRNAQRATQAGSVDSMAGSMPGGARDLASALDNLGQNVQQVPAGHAAAVSGQADALFGGGQPAPGPLVNARGLGQDPAQAAPAPDPMAGLSEFMTPEQRAATGSAPADPLAGALATFAAGAAAGSPDPFAQAALSTAAAAPGPVAQTGAPAQTAAATSPSDPFAGIAQAAPAAAPAPDPAAAGQQDFSFGELLNWDGKS